MAIAKTMQKAATEIVYLAVKVSTYIVRRSRRVQTVDLVTWCCRRPGCVAGCPWTAVRRCLTVDEDRRSGLSGYGRLFLI